MNRYIKFIIHAAMFMFSGNLYGQSSVKMETNYFFNQEPDVILEENSQGNFIKTKFYTNGRKWYKAYVKVDIIRDSIFSEKDNGEYSLKVIGKFRIVKNGKYFEWHDNGKLKMYGEYFFKGKEEKDGVWNYFNKLGVLIKTEFWRNGKIKEVLYPNDSFENGNQYD